MKKSVRKNMFKRLDHIAIVVRDTEDALRFYRDRLGLPLVLSEVIEQAGVRLTHLDLGNLHLQLVQPLRDDHPLQRHLDQHGEGLHHLCLLVDDLPEAVGQLSRHGLAPQSPEPHRGPRGRQAAFIDPATTRGVLWELTGEAGSP
jgi:methylmalonyl-CoA/ethylmalonyl-CoA epimerase